MPRSFYVVGEITAQLALPFFQDAKRITDVMISSPGGDIGLTLGMFDIAQSHGMRTHVAGLAQSAAAVLLQAGKRRTMTTNSLLMFHGAEEGATPAEIRLVEQLVEMVAKRAGTSVRRTRALFNHNFIKADRALELGLIVRFLFHGVSFVVCCFEPDIHFYVRTFGIDVRALKPSGQAPFGSEDLEQVLPLHAGFNLCDLT